jgi:hypothetical protein
MIAQGQPFCGTAFDSFPASFRASLAPHGFPMLEHSTNSVETVDVDLLESTAKPLPAASAGSTGSEIDALLSNCNHVLVVQCNVSRLARHLLPACLDSSTIDVLCLVHTADVTAVVDREINHVRSSHVHPLVC